MRGSRLRYLSARMVSTLRMHIQPQATATYMPRQVLVTKQPHPSPALRCQAATTSRCLAFSDRHQNPSRLGPLAEHCDPGLQYD